MCIDFAASARLAATGRERHFSNGPQVSIILAGGKIFGGKALRMNVRRKTKLILSRFPCSVFPFSKHLGSGAGLSFESGRWKIILEPSFFHPLNQVWFGTVAVKCICGGYRHKFYDLTNIKFGNLTFWGVSFPVNLPYFCISKR